MTASNIVNFYSSAPVTSHTAQWESVLLHQSIRHLGIPLNSDCARSWVRAVGLCRDQR